MKLILSHILTPVFYFLFGFFLVLFHPIQILTYNLFGLKAQQKVVFFLNKCLLRSLHVLGTRIHISYETNLPQDRPIIFVANHSSLHDITGIYALLGKYNPVFVSKKSLSKGIPSVSYNLRKSGAALIDRKDRIQAVAEIIRLGKYINDSNYSAVIFPEGTRRPELQPFKIGGLVALLKKAPNALVVPIAISGTGALYYNRKGYPLQVGCKLNWHVLKPIEPKEYNDYQNLLNQSYDNIKLKLDQN